MNADLFGNAQAFMGGQSIDAADLFGESVEEPTEKVDLSGDGDSPENNEPKSPQEEKKNNIPDGPVDAEDLFGNEESEEQESVGDENKENEEETTPKKTGSSPKGSNLYSSFAQALQGDGLFQVLDKDTVDSITDADSFREAIDKEVEGRLDDVQKRVNEALNYGVSPSRVAQYERYIQSLSQITDDALSDESQKGINLRKTLIRQDYLNKGLTPEKAEKWVERSFELGSDVEDATEALESVKTYFNTKYQEEIQHGREEAEAEKAKAKKQVEDFKKGLLEKDKLFDDIPIDKATRKKAYDVMTRIVKTNEDGEQLTAVQLYADEHPVEFRTVLGLIFTMTDGFTKMGNLLTKSVNKKVNQNLKDIENTLRNSSHQGGSFRYAEGDETPQRHSKFGGVRIDI